MGNKLVTDMNEIEAFNYFMKNSSYCTLDLPEYFNFKPLLDNIFLQLNGRKLSNFNSNISVENVENVNYKLVSNKDGKFAWRPYELIHPALYVQLVKDITERNNWNLICKRLKCLESRKIVCCSMLFDSDDDSKLPIIINWWEKFEQESIATALEFEYIACADITDCYGSIYTHTISWAIHGKKIAKNNKRDKKLIGNVIDKSLQRMHYNQTNGIPQGSKLTDFLAEILLTYADNELAHKLRKLRIKEYKILRYRDDYKIFAHDSVTINNILKALTEVLLDINLKVNATKTFISDDIISNSIKNDKIYAIENLSDKNISLQKYLLAVRDMVKKYNSSGAVVTCLKKLYVEKIKNQKNNIEYSGQMISILIDIMVINPKTYSVCIAIVSKLLLSLSSSERKRIIGLIRVKFSKKANTEYLDVWLQRLTVVDNKYVKYNAKLCKKIYCGLIKIWDSTWTNLNIKEELIIDNNILKNIKPVIETSTLKNEVHES